MTKVRNEVLNRGCVKLQRREGGAAKVTLCVDTCLQNELKN